MPWVRIDDRFPEHEKIVAGGPLAIALQVRALCYCARNLTDGRLSRGIVAMMAHDLDGFGAADMERAGLWEKTTDGWLVHDYLAYNPSRKQVEAERAAVAERVRKFRENRKPSRNAVTNAAPVPDPDPEAPSRSRTRSRPKGDCGDTAAAPAALAESPDQTIPRGSRPTPTERVLACPTCVEMLNLVNDALVTGYTAPGRTGEWLHRAHSVVPATVAVAVVRREVEKHRLDRKGRRWLQPMVLFKPENWDTTVNRQESTEPEWEPPEKRAARGDTSGLAGFFPRRPKPEPA